MNTFTASNGYKVTPNSDGANVYRELQENVSKADLARALMVSRPTLDRWLYEYKGGNK